MSINRITLYCVIGTILEWYDFAIFGVLASTLATLFFPHDNKTNSLIFVFAIFATAFVMRPIGGIVLGHIGDKYGRKKAVVISVLLMTVATVGIGCLPTPSHLSYPIILLFIGFRLFQGFSVGGESAGLITFIGELSGKKRFFLYQSFLAAGSMIGFLLGAVVAGLAVAFYDHGVHGNAWRFPFLLSVLLGLFGLYLRVKAVETPIFQQMKKQHKLLPLPIKKVIQQHYKTIVAFVLISPPSAISFYYSFIYYPNYIRQTNINHNYALLIGTIGLLALSVFLPVVGYLTNFNNLKKIVRCGITGFIFLGVPAVILMSKYPFYFAVPCVIIFAFLISLLLSNVPALISLNFKNNMRYTGTALITNLLVIVGGFTPLISSLLIKKTTLSYAPVFYLGSMAFIAVIVLFSCDKLLFNIQHD